MPNNVNEVDIIEDGQWLSCIACPYKLMQCVVAVAVCKCEKCKTKQFVIAVKDVHMVMKMEKNDGIMKAYSEAKKRIERILTFIRE